MRAHPRLGDVFLDVNSIEPGTAFLAEIRRALGRDPVCLVMIGPAWQGQRPDSPPRIADPGDFVRTEVEAALSAGLRVIPILAGGAAMPAPADLPETLAPLSALSAVALRHETFEQDMESLIDAIMRRRRAGAMTRLARDYPGVSLAIHTVAGFAAAALLLLALAVLHSAVVSRSLEETLGGAGPVWLLIGAGLALGAAAGFRRGRHPA